MPKTTLTIMIGKMGAGKSTAAKRHAEQTHAVLISEDPWLSALYPDEIQSFEDFRIRHRRLLDVLHDHIVQLLKAGVSIILDFPANTRSARAVFIGVAEQAGVPIKAIYLNTPDEVCLQRIARRRLIQPEHTNTDTPEMFAITSSMFEAPDPEEGIEIDWLES